MGRGLKEKHRVVLTINAVTNRVGCPSLECHSRSSTGALDAGIIEARHQTLDRITRSVVGGTRILQVLSVSEFAGDAESNFCANGACGREEEVLAVLPQVFGLKARKFLISNSVYEMEYTTHICGLTHSCRPLSQCSGQYPPKCDRTFMEVRYWVGYAL